MFDSDEDERLARALELYDSEEYAAAEPLLRDLAERGDVVAQFKLGNLLDRTDREAESIRWLRAAAEEGHTGAMINLAIRLGGDEEVAWLRRAVDLGHPVALRNLGLLLWKRGDVSEATELLERGAARGNGWAAAALAVKLKHEDDGAARHWALQAASLGCRQGHNLLTAWALNDDENESGLDWALRGLEVPTSDVNESVLFGNLYLAAALHLQAMRRYEEAVQYFVEAERRGKDVAEKIEECRSAHVLQVAEGDAPAAVELLKQAVHESELGWDDPEVLLRRLELVDEAARTWQLDFALSELAGIRSAIESSVPASPEFQGGLRDRQTFYAALAEGAGDHLEDDPEEGVIRFDDIDSKVRWLEEGARGGFPDVFPDLLRKETQAFLGGLLRDGFLVEGFLAARRLAVGGNHEAMRALGTLWIDVGDIEAGLGWLERAAREGFAPALAQYEWLLLQMGLHQRAVAFFAETNAACQALSEAKEGAWAMEVAEARSSDALHRLALGGDPEQARVTWRECAQVPWHLLSTLHLAVLSAAEGDVAEADALLDDVSSWEIEDLSNMFEAASKPSEGWFRDWALSVVKVLQRADSD